MQIRINGDTGQLPENATVLDAVAASMSEYDGAIVFLNGEMLHREYWTRTKLSPDDKLEIVRYVGGG